jgi:RNA 2',3'-cyclic 3'-phosphodiesterase
MRFSCEPPPRGEPRHAIFFALYPPAEQAAVIAHFTDRMFEAGRLRGPRVARERLHISLNPLGEYPVLPEPFIAQVRDTVASLKRRPFEVVLNRTKSFRNKETRPCVLIGDDGVIGIDGLYSVIHEILTEAGLPRGRARITPHLTLSYEQNELPDDFIEPVSWRVEEFRLIHSPRGESRHNVLGCWPLVE